MNTLENRFHEDMKAIYSRAKKEIGYNATRFLQLVAEKGGLLAAKQLYWCCNLNMNRLFTSGVRQI